MRCLPLPFTLLLGSTLIVGCAGDDGGPDPTGTTTTETGTPPDPEPSNAVIVVAGPSFLPTRTSDALTVSVYNTDVTEITWTSDDASVLTVDGAGGITAVAPGIATVTAELVDLDGTVVSDSHGVVVDNAIPFYDEWRASAHAAYDSESFTHWNEDGEISVSCARCHSTPGYRDFVGADGSAPGSVDRPAVLGSAVECAACHSDEAEALEAVTFPSGVRVSGLGSEARCMTCHQGRSSGDDLDAAFATEGVSETPDVVDTDLGFTNIHYYPAGATLFAGEVRGGYQYPGQVYDWRFRHVDRADTCTGCHDPHSLELRLETCQDCHAGVTDVDAVKDIREAASEPDYDGDGDTDEGIYYEIEGLRAEVFDSLQTYVVDRGQPALCYDSAAYPYFFVDTNGDGSCSEAEAAFPNAYTTWSARSLAAAYNYQLATKDPGNFAHNAKYTIQLLHDSLQDLNLGLNSPKDLGAFVRNDVGHFNGAGEAARHWDRDVEVDARCSTCHGGEAGLEFYLQYGVGLEGGEPDNGLECQTCHVGLSGETPDLTAIRVVDEVTFPSGVTLSAEPTSNLCMTCHSGRESGASVDARITSGNLGFVNVHYRAAGATLFGADARVGYEYENRSYAGKWEHIGDFDTCNFCHLGTTDKRHTFAVADTLAAGDCALCHPAAVVPADLRGGPLASSGHREDHDGDNDASEPLAGELETIADALLDEIYSESGDTLCVGDGYPYFFTDLDGTGPRCEADEVAFGNAFAGWTPSIMKAVFNWQYWHTEPGAWAHNFDYMAQLLIDSIEDLGGDVDGYIRPDTGG